MITLTYDLNVYSDRIATSVHLSQYDSNFTLVFNLISSYGIFTMESGTTAKIRFTKPDGNGYSKSGTVSVQNRTVTIAGDNQMTAVAGAFPAEIVLMNDDKELSTVNFMLDIEKAPMDASTVPSESVIEEIDAAVDEYMESHDIYVDPTLSVEGRPADAKATGDLKSAIYYLGDFSGGNLVETTGGYKHGYYLDADGTEHIGAAWAITQFIPVASGKKYRYSGVTTSLTNSRCFYYNNGTPILDSVFQLKIPSDVITAPENATHIRFTVNINNGDVNTFSFNAEDDSLNTKIINTEKTLSSLYDGMLETSAYNKETNVSGNLDATANIVTAVAWEVTDFMAVIPGAKYVYNGLTYIGESRSNCFFYDAHKMPLLATRFIPSTGSNILNVPENAFYVRFTVNHNVGDMNTFNLKWFNPLIGTGTTIEVSKDGTKSFSSIKDAYDYAYKIQSVENPVTILIYPGTYDEVLECTSANDSPYAWGAYVSFVGINKKDVIWRNDSGLYKNSPLHTSNPGVIKGITFIATHDDNPTFESTYADHTQPSQQNYGAYGLHIDDPTNSSAFDSPAFETIIEDCVIISKQHAAIGIGLRANQTLTIRNCYFLMDIPSALENSIDSKKGAFLFHRIMADGTFVQNLIIDNNTIETNMGKVLYTYNNGGNIKVDVTRNLLWSEINTNSNAVINGSIDMVTAKSFGNNVLVLNKS